MSIPRDYVTSNKKKLKCWEKITDPIIWTTGGGTSPKPAAAGETSVVIPKMIKGMDWNPKRVADKEDITALMSNLESPEA